MTRKTALLIGGPFLAVVFALSGFVAGLAFGRPATKTATNTPAIAVARGSLAADVAQGSASSGLAVAPFPVEIGPPPFGQLSGDGISVYGVATKQVASQDAQPDNGMVKSAFEDARKKAEALASAAGIKLGSILALSQYSQAQPYFKGCPVPEAVPQKGAPVPNDTIAQPAPAIAPVQPCNSETQLVVWVLARYQVQS